MVEARALKLCTKGDYIKSGQRDDKAPQKGVWFCSRDPSFLHNCGLEKISSRHAVIRGINKIVDGPQFLSPSTVDAAVIH